LNDCGAQAPSPAEFWFYIIPKTALDDKVMALTLVFPWVPFSESWQIPILRTTQDFSPALGGTAGNSPVRFRGPLAR
jgi:hypothetical protein